jgi:phosphoserine phosphatase RsbU/P
MWVPDSVKTVLLSGAFLLTDLFKTDSPLTEGNRDQDHLLGEVGDGSHATESAGRLLLRMAEVMAKLLRASRFVVLINEGGHYRLVEAVGYSAMPTASLSEGDSILKHLEREPRPCSVCFNDDERALWVWYLPDDERALLEDLRAHVLIPIKAKGRLLALIGVGPKEPDEQYSDAELRLLEMLVSQTSSALEHRQLSSAPTPRSPSRRGSQRFDMARELVPDSPLPTPDARLMQKRLAQKLSQSATNH